MQLSSKSNKAGVIGDPISHSLSPKLHGYLLEKYHIDGTYLPFKVAKEDLKSRIDSFIELGFAGFNVTIPHKESIIKFCNELSQRANAIGAVNTVVIDPHGKLHGDNSDGVGFINNIKQNQPNFNFKGKHVIVLGAGGAARAICFSLMEAEVKEIIIVNRSLDNAKHLQDDFCKLKNFKTIITAEDWEKRNDIIQNCDLLINTTSLGMIGQAELEINLTNLKPNSLVTDIVYKPLMTKLLSDAKNRGNPIVTGIGMLIYQGLVGFEAWYGIKPEVDETLVKNMIEAST